jgi:hypothetical protein
LARTAQSGTDLQSAPFSTMYVRASTYADGSKDAGEKGGRPEPPSLETPRSSDESGHIHSLLMPAVAECSSRPPPMLAAIFAVERSPVLPGCWHADRTTSGLQEQKGRPKPPEVGWNAPSKQVRGNQSLAGAYAARQAPFNVGEANGASCDTKAPPGLADLRGLASVAVEVPEVEGGARPGRKKRAAGFSTRRP